MNHSALIQRLAVIDAIKTGEFTLKSGLISPIYIDFRSIISYPILLQKIADFMWEKIRPLDFDYICGVPYTALPIATAISIAQQIPMIMVRKEAKNYGTKKMVEGRFEANKRCIIIEDVVTTGSSVLTTMKELNQVGLQTPYTVALVDRNQGGHEALLKVNCELMHILTLAEILQEVSVHA